MEYRRHHQQRYYKEIKPEKQTGKATSSTLKTPPGTVKHSKCRSAIDFLRERWRGDVVHHPCDSPSLVSMASRNKPARRCLSQPARDMVATDGDERSIFPGSVISPMESGRRDASVQCSIIEWNQAEKRVELIADDASRSALLSSSLSHIAAVTADNFADDYRSRRFLYGASLSSQELSLAATDGSGSTTFGGTDPGNDDNSVNGAEGGDDDEEQAFLKWYMIASSACVHGAHTSPPASSSQSMADTSPPASSSQSMAALGCVKLAGPGCVPTRVERLRHEFRQCRGASGTRSASCQSEPEVVRCCSASTAAAAVAPRIDVEAWRRQFRRRKAITLSDIEVNQALLGSYVGHDDRTVSSMSTDNVAIAAATAEANGRSFIQRSAATQQRFFHCIRHKM